MSNNAGSASSPWLERENTWHSRHPGLHHKRRLAFAFHSPINSVKISGSHGSRRISEPKAHRHGKALREEATCFRTLENEVINEKLLYTINPKYNRRYG